MYIDLDYSKQLNLCSNLGLNYSKLLNLCSNLDLDSEVSSGGLDRILPPPSSSPSPNQPKVRSFFQSVTVTKVVKPDGVRTKKNSQFDVDFHYI